MIARLVLWLFHVHSWKDFGEHTLKYRDGTVAGTNYVQKCEKCGNFRAHKIMAGSIIVGIGRGER